jgi:prefoldin subunit 5
MSENKSALSDLMQNIEALQSQSKLLEEEIKNITQTHEEKRF